MLSNKDIKAIIGQRIVTQEEIKRLERELKLLLEVLDLQSKLVNLLLK